MNPRIAKITFTGSTAVGQQIMQYATENIIPVTLELGGKSPNIFFEDVMAQQDDYLEKALEGFTMFALNQGEICTCPSRALVRKVLLISSWNWQSIGLNVLKLVIHSILKP